MPNQKTSDYSLVSVAQLTSLIDLANSGVDNEAITVADFLTQIGAGNLGSIDLIQSDPNRTFTFSSNEPSNDLRFRNLSLEESLVINAGCDVYNRGRQQDSTTTIYGFDSGRDLVGNRNTLFGDSVLTETLLGSDNTAFGYQAGHFITGGVVDVTEANCLIAIGSNTRPLADSGTNEIIVGCNLTGNGSNTVTIGDANILNNYFNGDMNIAGLAGVGDRNLVVDATGLLKVATTTNNILSFANLGSFPGTGVIDTIYIALDTDLMYIWDTVNLAYVVFSGDTIYSVNGTITDLTRTLLLNTSDSTSTFQIGNSATNPIMTFRGDLEVFIKPLKATAGNTFNITIDDAGMLSSAVQSLQSIYTGAGVMTQNAFVDGTGSAFDIDFVNIGDFSILTGGPTKDITFGAGGNVVISLNNLQIKNSGFDLDLIADTLTADRSVLVQDGDGTLAFLSDIANIYTTDGTTGAGRIISLTDSLRFQETGGDLLFQIEDDGKFALGINAVIGSDQNVIIGKEADAGGCLRAVVIGDNASSPTGTAANVIIGALATTSSNSQPAVSVGFNSNSADQGTSVGNNTVSGVSAVAVGTNASSSGGVAVGGNASAPSRSVAIGLGAIATDTGMAMGHGCTALVSGGIGIGYLITSVGNSAITMGVLAVGTGARSIAMGRSVESVGQESIAIGYEAVSSSADSMGIGRGAAATAVGSQMIGYGNIATKITNSTADSIGFGWDTATPDVLFAKTADQYIAGTGDLGIGLKTPLEKLHSSAKVRANTGFNFNGNDGITEVLTFAGGGSGDVASLTIEGGIVTSRTLVP